MRHLRCRLNAIATLCAVGSTPFACPAKTADAAAASLDAAVIPVVIVTGSRTEHTRADFPAAIKVVDAREISDTHMRVNASESLVAVPGLVIRNRQNHAQDLRISSRGFGARSQSGRRRAPDRRRHSGHDAGRPGTGGHLQSRHGRAHRNAVRTVFRHLGQSLWRRDQLFTREEHGLLCSSRPCPAAATACWKVDLNAQGENGDLGYVLDASRFGTEGTVHTARPGATRVSSS